MEVTKSGDNINVDLREVFVRRAGGLKWFIVVSSCGLLYWECELQILLNEANVRVSFYILMLFYDGVDPVSLNLKFNLNYLHCNRASFQFVLLMVWNLILVSLCNSFALQCICKERFVFFIVLVTWFLNAWCIYQHFPLGIAAVEHFRVGSRSWYFLRFEHLMKSL
jgi:hypothetical protein